MKKRADKFDKEIQEIVELGKMLDSKRDDDAKRAYAIIVAKSLFSIEVSLSAIRFALFCLLGLVTGKFLSGLF